jgi:hypothetical protein
MRNAYKILDGKPKGQEPLGRPRRNEKILLKLILRK